MQAHCEVIIKWVRVTANGIERPRNFQSEVEALGAREAGVALGVRSLPRSCFRGMTTLKKLRSQLSPPATPACEARPSK